MIIHDYRKKYRSLYQVKTGRIEVVEIPPLQFITQKGIGRLNEIGRPEADVSAIWKTVNQLKRISKERYHVQFKLMPIETVWHEHFAEEEWSYTNMMQVPDFIDMEMYEEATANVRKGNSHDTFTGTKLVTVHQGRCIHKLHEGHYRDTNRTLEELYKYADDHEMELNEGRREVYINQPGCNPPERWKSIVRVQVRIT
ncbi:GyrI-like domain-containing protein [Paenibacillus tarimensis]